MLYLYSNLLPIISPVSLFGRNTSLDYLDIADLSIYKTRLIYFQLFYLIWSDIAAVDVSSYTAALIYFVWPIF